MLRFCTHFPEIDPRSAAVLYGDDPRDPIDSLSTSPFLSLWNRAATESLSSSKRAASVRLLQRFRADKFLLYPFKRITTNNCSVEMGWLQCPFLSFINCIVHIRVSVEDNERLSISISALEFFHISTSLGEWEKLQLDMNDPVYSVVRAYAKD